MAWVHSLSAVWLASRTRWLKRVMSHFPHYASYLFPKLSGKPSPNPSTYSGKVRKRGLPSNLLQNFKIYGFATSFVPLRLAKPLKSLSQRRKVGAGGERDTTIHITAMCSSLCAYTKIHVAPLPCPLAFPSVKVSLRKKFMKVSRRPLIRMPKPLCAGSPLVGARPHMRTHARTLVNMASHNFEHFDTKRRLGNLSNGAMPSTGEWRLWASFKSVVNNLA